MVLGLTAWSEHNMAGCSQTNRPSLDERTFQCDLRMNERVSLLLSFTPCWTSAALEFLLKAKANSA